MKLALSNLAIPRVDAATLTTLRAAGLNGIEVAPTRIAPWEELTPSALKRYRTALESEGFSVPALQAIFHGIEGAALLRSEHAFGIFREHLIVVAEIADALGAPVIVLGAPATRKHLIDNRSSRDRAIERLRRCASDLESCSDTTLVLEPVPPHYGGEFANTPTDAAVVVHQVDHSRLRLHLDTGCALLGCQSISLAVTSFHEILRHFHISEPGLAGFAQPAAHHIAAANALASINYNHWLSIEMKGSEESIYEALVAVQFVIRTYGEIIYHG